MKRSLWFLAGLVAILCILVAGCTQSPQGEGATPVPTTQPTTVAATPTQAPATPATPAQPGFIDGPVPAQYAVDVQVHRNTVAIKPTIIVTFRGGKGINFVDSMDVVVHRSDGQVVTGSLQRPSVNSQLELEGTRGTDRVEVFINLVTGDRYRVYNQALPFRSYS